MSCHSHSTVFSRPY